MEVRPIRAGDVEYVYRLLACNDWAHRIGSVAQFEKLLNASQVAVVAVIDGHIVGFARGISDGISNGYLAMVVVQFEHRGKGIGRALVERAIGGDSRITWVLRAGREGAAEFFAKLGFERSALAMERRRVQAAS